MNWGGGNTRRHMHQPHTPQCPLFHYALEKLRAAAQLTCCMSTCVSLIALADTYFLFKCLPLYAQNAKIDLRSVSRDAVCVQWFAKPEWKMSSQRCSFIFINANNMYFLRGLQALVQTATPERIVTVSANVKLWNRYNDGNSMPETA